MNYTISINKTGPTHWVLKTVIDTGVFKIETVAGGLSIREAIINCIDLFKKKNLEADMTAAVTIAINDLETML